MAVLCQKDITKGILTQIPLRFEFGGFLPSGTRLDACHLSDMPGPDEILPAPNGADS